MGVGGQKSYRLARTERSISLACVLHVKRKIACGICLYLRRACNHHCVHHSVQAQIIIGNTVRALPLLEPTHMVVSAPLPCIITCCDDALQSLYLPTTTCSPLFSVQDATHTWGPSRMTLYAVICALCSCPGAGLYVCFSKQSLSPHLPLETGIRTLSIVPTVTPMYFPPRG